MVRWEVVPTCKGRSSQTEVKTLCKAQKKPLYAVRDQTTGEQDENAVEKSAQSRFKRFLRFVERLRRPADKVCGQHQRLTLSKQLTMKRLTPQVLLVHRYRAD